MSFTVIANTAAIPYEEWLERRKEGIGGSDAAVVCGVSRYKSPVELWMEKTGQLPAQEAGEAAYWGHQLEELVRTEFTKRTGIQVEHRMELLRSDQHSFMQANLDGTCRQPDLGPCVFEAKNRLGFQGRGVGGRHSGRILSAGAALHGSYRLPGRIRRRPDRRQQLPVEAHPPG